MTTRGQFSGGRKDGERGGEDGRQEGARREKCAGCTICRDRLEDFRIVPFSGLSLKKCFRNCGNIAQRNDEKTHSICIVSAGGKQTTASCLQDEGVKIFVYHFCLKMQKTGYKHGKTPFLYHIYSEKALVVGSSA